MRALKTFIIAALIVAPATVSAQASATVYRRGESANIRATMGLVIPEIVRVVETQSAERTRETQQHVEYLIKYTVAANTQWQFAADALPYGVSLLTWGGEWRDASNPDLVVQRGAVSNGTEILVRVRVADGVGNVRQPPVAVLDRAVVGLGDVAHVDRMARVDADHR